MECRPLDKNHSIGDRRGEHDGPICDAVCDCMAVECKTTLGIDGETAGQLAACLKKLECVERRVVLCFEKMRMPGLYVREYYERELKADVILNPRDICKSAGCF